MFYTQEINTLIAWSLSPVTLVSVLFCLPGLTQGGDDLLFNKLTHNITHTSLSPFALNHGEFVYATVKCTNSLGLSTEVTSEGQVVVSQPPLSDSAYVQFNPQSHSVFASRDGFQAARDNLDFEFHGFKDAVGLEVKVTLYR